MQHFIGDEHVQRFYTDNAPELIRAGKDLKLLHDTNTPNRSDTNGVAEHAVRRTVEGTRTSLLQAGFPPPWWPWAMRHWCHARNIEIIDGDSAWNKRHKQGQWKGPVIPFGAKVWYRPSPYHADYQQKFELAGRVGIFLGYHLLNGCKWKRNGGLLVCDL